MNKGGLNIQGQGVPGLFLFSSFNNEKPKWLLG